MNIGMLALTQAPPLQVPLRFMLTAPLFGVLAGLLMLFQGETILASRWSMPSLMGVHAMVLGFMLMVMMGAMQQLLPVLAGVTIVRVKLVGLTTYLLLLIGTLVLLAGFGWQHPGMLQIALGVLFSAVVIFVSSVGYALLKTPSSHATIKVMIASMLALLITLGIITVLLNRASWQVPIAHPLTDLHLGWGLIGTMGLLLIGVAYQVVPMFQITPEYPASIRRYLGLGIGGGLVLLSIIMILVPDQIGLRYGAALWLSGLMGLFAVSTLRLQSQRRRRLPDITLSFWRISMVSLMLAIASWWGGVLLVKESLYGASLVLFLFGFVTAAITGMLFKIVPFLVWLHLNNQMNQLGAWQGTVPTMRQVIPEAYGRWQFRLHLLGLITLTLAVFGVEWLIAVSGVVWLLFFSNLLWAQVVGVRRYCQVLEEMVTN